MPVDAATIADQLMLGRYRVLEERGKGGFGTVSVCWDPRLMRRVAIKTIPLSAARPPAAPSPRRARPPRDRKDQRGPQDQHDPADAERLLLLRAALAETRTASMLAHPSIVAMLDFESDDENAYIIMEYVEGASLAELLDATDDGLLTDDEAAAVAEAVTDALQFAHDNGVLHLDIKPDNILVDMSGRVKLADFGMAALSSVTGFAGARGGTLGYMPPEQIECEAVDVRTDVFAFAAVMYEALTGFRPFAAQSLSQSLELTLRGAADPCALNESVSTQVADALLAALDPDPAYRPRSAEEFGEELVAGLGRPKAGRKSLAAFVADVLDDSRDPDPALSLEGNAAEGGRTPGGAAGHGGDGARRAAALSQDGLGPASRTLPNLAPRALRSLGAVCAALAAARCALALAPSGPTGATAALVTCAVVLVLGIAAPPLAGALGFAALAVAACGSGMWLLGLPLAVVAVAWWMLVGRSQPLASSGTLAAAVVSAFGASGAAAILQTPVTPLVCGYLLPPGHAALSALAGWLAAGALICLAEPSAPAAVGALGDLASSASFWVWGAGWVAAAAVMGALCHGGTKSRCYLGCGLSCVAIVAFGLVAGRVENGGSWTAPTAEVLAAAVGSTILVALLVLCFGSPSALDVDGVGFRAGVRDGTDGSDHMREDA